MKTIAVLVFDLVNNYNHTAVDGIILIPNSFTSYIDFDKLSKELEMYSGKPVVSISRKIDLPGSKYTYNTSAYAYDLVIEHLKNKHNCNRNYLLVMMLVAV